MIKKCINSTFYKNSHILSIKMNKTEKILINIIVLFSILILFNGCNKKNDVGTDIQNMKKEIKIDVNNSSIIWTAYKKGGQHKGTIKFLSGDFKLAEGLPVSGNCSVDMNSIGITDIKDSNESRKALDFLKSKSFLDVERFPSAIVNIRSIIPLRNVNMPDVNTTIKGNITIKDSTLLFAVSAFTSYYKDSIVSRAKFSLNGANWNIPLKTINIDKDYKENPYKEDYDLEVYIVAR